eukprot:scaffold64962_cov63-Phaeocystis_antarctica.AAC.2
MATSSAAAAPTWLDEGTAAEAGKQGNVETGAVGLGWVHGAAACAHLASRIEQLRLVGSLRRPRGRSLGRRSRGGRGRGSRRHGCRRHGACGSRWHCGCGVAADRATPRSAGGSWQATTVAGRVRIALGELLDDLLARPVQRCALVRQLLPVIHPGTLEAGGAALAPATLRHLAGHSNAPPLALLLVAEHRDATRRCALLEVEPAL